MEQIYTTVAQLDTPVAPSPQPVRRLNGYGIAALLISLGAAAGLALMVIASAVLVASGARESEPALVVVGLLIFAGLGGDLLSIGLGVAGLFQAGRGKATSVIAIMLSATTLALVLMMIVVGLASR